MVETSTGLAEPLDGEGWGCGGVRYDLSDILRDAQDGGIVKVLSGATAVAHRSAKGFAGEPDVGALTVGQRRGNKEGYMKGQLGGG